MSEIQFTSLDPKDLSQQQVHQFLITAIAPRPICFASTVDESGKVNLSPFSFFNVFSSNPPIMIFSPARSGRDNTTKHTLDNVLEVKEVSISIVNYAIVEQMSLASTAYAKGIDEFVKAGLTPLKSDKIKPPRVMESPVSFECIVNEVVALGNGPGGGNLVICEVVKIHIQNKYLDSQGKLDTTTLDLVARMGGAWYTRSTSESLFTIPKPLQTKGIGVDSLPGHVQSSKVLTGNDLGRLGNTDSLPNEKELIANMEKYLDPIKDDLKGQDQESILKRLHSLAQQQLNNGDTQSAICTLINSTALLNGDS